MFDDDASVDIAAAAAVITLLKCFWRWFGYCNCSGDDLQSLMMLINTIVVMTNFINIDDDDDYDAGDESYFCDDD